MSSLVRRIERTVAPSQPHSEKVRGEWKHNIISPPRDKHFHGRGSKLGVRNPKAKDKLARETRAKARGEQVQS